MARARRAIGSSTSRGPYFAGARAWRRDKTKIAYAPENRKNAIARSKASISARRVVRHLQTCASAQHRDGSTLGDNVASLARRSRRNIVLLSQVALSPKRDTARMSNRNSDKPDDGRPVVVKKYANRRLYNTATSSYVTLDDLARMIKDGGDFVAYD